MPIRTRSIDGTISPHECRFHVIETRANGLNQTDIKTVLSGLLSKYQDT